MTMTLVQPLVVICFYKERNTFTYHIRSIRNSGARLWNTLLVPIRDSESASVLSGVSAVDSLPCTWPLRWGPELWFPVRNAEILAVNYQCHIYKNLN